jgi:ABC-type uncharacterized transport system ATPase subunit
VTAPAKDIKILFDRIRSLKSRASFVFVSHRLDEVLAISDRIYVMKDAEVVAERIAGATSVASLHAMMVGRDLDAEYYREARQGLCHTILVMRDGEITARFNAPPYAKPAQVALLEHMV